MGPIYDCHTVNPIGAYRLPYIRQCQHNMHKLNANVSVFMAQVHKYQPTVTPLEIYFCKAELMSLSCKTNFIGVKSKTSQLKELEVTAKECLSSLLLLQSPYGKLYEVQDGLWRTRSRDHYECSWMRTKHIDFFHFSIQRFPAQIRGNDHRIIQHLTQTECLVNVRSCKPKERPKAVVVWRPVRHQYNPMKNLGTFKVERLGNFVLIRELKIGGAIQIEKEKGKFLILDNGIMFDNVELEETVYHKYEKKFVNFTAKLPDNPDMPCWKPT